MSGPVTRKAEVLETVRPAIVSGEIAPGEILNEVALAREGWASASLRSCGAPRRESTRQPQDRAATDLRACADQMELGHRDESDAALAEGFRN